MNPLIAMLSALPLGDDTPIGLYTLLGCGALVMMIVAMLLGKKPKKK